MSSNVQLTHNEFLHSPHERGSATMEYVIVSTFAALLSIASITFVGKLVKGRVDHMASKLGVETTEFDLDLSFEH